MSQVLALASEFIGSKAPEVSNAPTEDDDVPLWTLFDGDAWGLNEDARFASV